MRTGLPGGCPGVASVIDLARAAIDGGVSLAEAAEAARLGRGGGSRGGRPCWPPIDHPDPAHLLMTGTGLTHLGSAESRDKMHRAAAETAELTDSMRMFLMGVEGGKPAGGGPGVQPEWFYKGDGSQLVAPGRPIAAPAFGLEPARSPRSPASI